MFLAKAEEIELANQSIIEVLSLGASYIAMSS
jgi:hypothetical protein